MSSGHSLVHFVSTFCLDSAGLGCLYLLVASVTVLYSSRKAVHRSPRTPVPVSILKPLHGEEPGLTRRLISACRQNYPADVQLVCGVEENADPAVGAVKSVKAELPDEDIALVCDSRQHGINRKISNLTNMLPLARHEVLVISDSDIDVPPNYLNDIVAELERPGVGAVTCLYHGLAGPGRWSKCAALGINLYFLPNVLVALTFGLARPCFGSTVALRRSMLTQIGGLQTIANCLADDFALGAAVREQGYAVAVSRVSVGHFCFARSLRTLLANEIRAARTIRTIDPIGYAGTFFCHPFPLALIASMLDGNYALSAAALALCCRMVLCFAVESAFSLQRQQYWLIPLRDVLSFFVFFVGFVGNTVAWRGSSYRINSDGSLVSEQESARP